MSDGGLRGGGATVAVLSAMPTELRPFVRALSLRPGEVGRIPVRTGSAGTTPVVAAVIGVGPERAGRVAGQLLDAVPVGRVLVIGVAGGVDPALAVGDLLAPRVVVDQSTGDELRPHHSPGVEPAGVLLTSAALMTGDDSLARLRARGVSAVDMETAGVAGACELRGCPWSVYRAVSDTLAEGLVDEHVLGLTRPDGGTDLGAVARLLCRHPGQMRRLARLGRDTRKAVAAITRAALDDVGAR